MRAVAQYVMRGRAQALLVSVLGASSLLFAWISAAVIALVTLRRGPGEGAYLLAWAALPAGFLMVAFGDTGPLGMITGTMALAILLRWSQSWPLALLGAAALGAVSGILLLLLAQGLLEQLAGYFREMFEQLRQQLPEADRERAFELPGTVMIAGMLGLVNAVSCTLCLVLARWWQATLYNPGGFREEFHALRFSPQVSVALVLGLLLMAQAGPEYRPWAVLLAIPLSVAGLGFIHARAAHRGLVPLWLWAFYLLWLVFDPVKLAVVLVAVADSFLDFRGRWQKQLAEEKKEKDTDSDES